LWNVETQASSGRSPRSASTRPRISAAALLVKVTASTWREGTPRSSTRCAIRCVITRVLPLPAPARISTGPFTAATASRCCGLRPASEAAASSTELLDRDGLGEVAGLVDVAAGAQRHVVGDQLEREHGEERRPQLRALGDLEQHVAVLLEDRLERGVARLAHRDHAAAARLGLLQVREHLV